MTTNPDFEIAPELITLARRWPKYRTTGVHMYVCITPQGEAQRVEEVVDIHRCCQCHEEIYAASEGHQVVAHLLLSHGYRMDGRQWNGRNELIGHA